MIGAVAYLRVLGLRGRDRAFADHDPRDARRDPDRPPGAVAAQPRAVGADRARARARDAPRPELSDVLCGGGGADRRGGMAAPAPRRRGAADGLRLANGSSRRRSASSSRPSSRRSRRRRTAPIISRTCSPSASSATRWRCLSSRSSSCPAPSSASSPIRSVSTALPGRRWGSRSRRCSRFRPG